jgi:hypothetical protein
MIIVNSFLAIKRYLSEITPLVELAKSFTFCRFPLSPILFSCRCHFSANCWANCAFGPRRFGSHVQLDRVAVHFPGNWSKDIVYIRNSLLSFLNRAFQFLSLVN